MSLKAYGEWLKKNLEVSSEEEIVRFMMEKRSAGCVEEPDDPPITKRLFVFNARKNSKQGKLNAQTS